MRAEVEFENRVGRTQLWVYTSKTKADERRVARFAPSEPGEEIDRSAGTVACQRDRIKLDEQDLADIRKVMYRIFKKHADLQARGLEDDAEQQQKQEPKR